MKNIIKGYDELKVAMREGAQAYLDHRTGKNKVSGQLPPVLTTDLF